MTREIRRQSVPGTQNVQFLLDKQARFVRNRLFRIADIHYAPGKSDLLDGVAKCLGQTDGFDHHIGSTILGYLQQTMVQRFARRVHGVGRAGTLGDLELAIV
jgi:hypothetical protein